jgi:hypothetical protein
VDFPAGKLIFWSWLFSSAELGQTEDLKEEEVDEMIREGLELHLVKDREVFCVKT